MAAKDVAPILAKEFVNLKLDYDRMPGAKELQLRYAGKNIGLPWFVFLRNDGSPTPARSPGKPTKEKRRC